MQATERSGSVIPQEDSEKRVRAKSTGCLVASQSEKILRRVPPLCLEAINKSSGGDTLTVKTPRSAQRQEIKLSPYTLIECRQDCKGDGQWEITSKYFMDEVIQEIRRVLDQQKMQSQAFSLFERSVGHFEEDLNDFKEAGLDRESILKIFKVKLQKLNDSIELAVESKKTEFRLISCQLSRHLMEAVIGENLKSLHLERTRLDRDICNGITAALKKGEMKLESLQLANVDVEPAELAIIFEGIIYRNRYENGIKNLCLVACRINEKADRILEELIGGSIHLESLNLETNELGSACKISKSIILTNAKQAESSKLKHNRLYDIQEDGDFTVKVNNSIETIVKGTIENRRIGGCLKMVILSDNQLTSEDRALLVSEEAITGNPDVQFNVSKNGLGHIFQKNRRLSYESPRGISSMPTDRINRTPRSLSQVRVRQFETKVERRSSHEKK